MLRPLLVLACSLLGACAALPGAPTSHERAGWKPLPPQSLGESRSVTQRLRVAHGADEFSLDCAVSVTPERITVIGLLPAGLRLFSVTYDGGHIEVQADQRLPDVFRPELLLNDLQLAFWPRRALEQALVDSGWSVTEPDSRTRRLRHDRRLIAEVHYADADPWNGRLWLTNLAHGYSLAIDSRSLE